MLYFNNSKFKKFVKFSLFSGIFVLLSACSGGLGSEIDMDAPELKITSHKNMDYAGRDFTLSGTCEDNIKVKKVIATYEYKNEEGKPCSKETSAKISKSEWSMDISIPVDQEIDIDVTAYDGNNNTDANSVRHITLVIDAAYPKLKSFYLNRNDTYPVSFKELDKVKSFYENCNKTGSKDFFQNESVILTGETKDNYKIDSVTLSLKDEDDNIVLSEIENIGTSGYVPKFELTQEMLTAVDSKYASGVWYFKPFLTIKDGAGNETFEASRYFAWWAEYDVPKILYTLESDNCIKVVPNSGIGITLFDDDGLDEFKYQLIPLDKWNNYCKTGIPLEEAVEKAISENEDNFKTKYFNGARDGTVTISGTEGVYYLVSRLKDKKNNGNPEKYSYKAVRTEITDGTLSTFMSISASVRANQIFTEGETVTIQANFSSGTSISSGKIELLNIKGVTEKQYAIYKKGSGSDTLIFEYSVPEGAYTEAGEIVHSGAEIVDSVGLSSANSSIASDKTLENNSIVKIDAISPFIETYEPSQNAVLEGNKIILTFDDEIEVESGIITVERTSGWAIPPVFTADEFAEIYAALSDEDKINFIGSATGSPVLTDNSAQPVGPYKKVTHGVKTFADEPVKNDDGDLIYVDNTGDAVPDASTKYVLAFDLDIFDKTVDSKVSKIRKALEGYGYHKKDYDISDSAVEIDGKKLTITLDSNVLVDGREFTVTIPAGCVRDKAGNVNKELKRDTYKFWSQKTAKPVIRTDRYTHGADAPEPYLENGEIKIRTIGKEDITSAPTGQIRVRIDCETPNASIKYGIQTNKSEKGVSELSVTQSSKVANMTMSAFKALTCNQTYSKIFLAGESGWNYAEKNYIRAVATKSASGSEPALSESDSGLEMATKTVLYYSKPNSDREYLYFQGSDSIGEPVASAFPMRDANPDMRWSRYAYKTNTDSDAAAEDVAKARNNDWVCVSWDIITSNWRLQSITHNWQNPETKGLDYGILRYNVGQGYYD